MPHDGSHQMIKTEFSDTSLPEWSPTIKAKCVFGIAAGISYLYSRRVLHRNLKPQNILFDQNREPVICHFSLARVVGVGDFPVDLGIADTPLDMAPEVFANKCVAYGFRVDVYSYGMLLYMMFAADEISRFTTGAVPRMVRE
jgi:serine/threonine protein kinase